MASIAGGELEREAIRLARPQRGHFELGTGYHGDLWLDLDALFLRPALLRPHARWLAERLAGHAVDAVCGPMTGGAFLAEIVADQLGTAFLAADRSPPACRRPSSTQQVPVRYRLSPSARKVIGGWRVAIADDAINAGTAAQACFREVRDSGAAPVVVAALLSLGQASTVVEAAMAVPFYAVATIPSLVWPAGECPLCVAGTPLTDPL